MLISVVNSSQWDEREKPIISIGQLFKTFEEYCKVIKRLEDRDIFGDNEGMRKELRGVSCASDFQTSLL